MQRGLWVVGATAGLAGAARGQSTLYVDDDGPTGGDGSSWATAINDLDAALTLAGQRPQPVTIRIAGGWYVPRAPGGNPQLATFNVISGLWLYGGYRGLTPGGDPDERNIPAFVSTLSGLAESGRARHVVTAADGLFQPVLDGFTVRDGANENLGGAGLYAGGTPIIRYCTFADNECYWSGAGAIYLHGATGVPVTISGCTFVHNSGGAIGGPGAIRSQNPLNLLDCAFMRSRNDIGATAIQAPAVVATRCTFADNHGGVRSPSVTMIDCLLESNGDDPAVWATNAVLIRCVFRNNVTFHASGVVMGDITAANCVFDGNYSSGGTTLAGRLTAWNCLFTRNWSQGGGDGGALRLSPGSALVNCTLSQNRAPGWGGAIVATAGGVTITNSILWGNIGGTALERAQIYWGTMPPAVRYTVIEGWTGTLGGPGNSGADPRFMNPKAGDWRLGPASPCIDAADAAALPPDTYDLDGDGDTTEPLPLDLAMRPRVVDDPATANTGPGTPPYLDIGAFEYQTPACYANCDGSIAVPLLSVDDFVCFQGRFAAGEPYANCDKSSGTPALNVADFVCFLGRFVAGCP